MLGANHWLLLSRHISLLRRFAKANRDDQCELVLRNGAALFDAIWWAKDLTSHDDKRHFQMVVFSWSSKLRDLLDDGLITWDSRFLLLLAIAKQEYLTSRYDECLDRFLETVKKHGTEAELRQFINARVTYPAWRDETLDQALCAKYNLVYRTPAERFTDASKALGLDKLDLGR